MHSSRLGASASIGMLVIRYMGPSGHHPRGASRAWQPRRETIDPTRDGIAVEWHRSRSKIRSNPLPIVPVTTSSCWIIRTRRAVPRLPATDGGRFPGRADHGMVDANDWAVSESSGTSGVQALPPMPRAGAARRTRELITSGNGLSGSLGNGAGGIVVAGPKQIITFFSGRKLGRARGKRSDVLVSGRREASPM